MRLLSQKVLSYLFVGFTFIAFLYMTGCGGSSSNTPTPTPTPPPPPSTVSDIEGSGIKGIISNGIITAYRVVDGVINTEVLDTATTDENGDYSIQIPIDYSGVVAIELTASMDAANPSLMTCDAGGGCGSFDAGAALDLNANGSIDFGEQLELSSTFSMWAYKNTVGGVDISVNITPLTDMAAAYAASLPQGISSISVDTGNTQVADLFGITGDITTLTPPDLTDATAIGAASGEELEYALFAAAIGGLASGGASVADILDSLSQTFTENNGQLLLNSEDDIDFGDIAQLASDTAAVVADENPDFAGELDTLSEGYQDDADAADTAEEGEVTDAQPSPNAGDDDLVTVKAFIADIRNWNGVISLEAENAADAFELQISLAGELVDLETDAMGAVLMSLSDLALTMEDLELTMVNLADYFEGASGTMTWDPESRIASVDGVVDGVTVLINITIVGNESMTQWVFDVSGEIENDNASMSIVSGVVTVNYDQAFDPFADEPVDPEPVPTDASLALVVIIAQKSSSTVTDPVSFSGEIGIDLVQGAAGESDSGEVEENFLPSHFELSGTLSSASGSSFTASFTVNIANAETFTPPAPLPIGSVSEALASYSFNPAETELTVSTANWTLIFTWDESQSAIHIQCWGADGVDWCDFLVFDFTSVKHYADILITNVNGEFFGFWEFYVDDEGYYYLRLPEGIAEFDLAGGTLDGVLIYADEPDEDENNWIDFGFELSFDYTLTNFPAAEITISGDRSGFETGEVSIEISYGARRILIELDNVTETGIVTITNQDGVELVIDIAADPENDEEIVGQVKLDNVIWAEIRFADGAYIIVYADGTIETLI